MCPANWPRRSSASRPLLKTFRLCCSRPQSCGRQPSGSPPCDVRQSPGNACLNASGLSLCAWRQPAFPAGSLAICRRSSGLQQSAKLPSARTAWRCSSSQSVSKRWSCACSSRRQSADGSWNMRPSTCRTA